jgi:hypothetical protein
MAKGPSKTPRISVNKLCEFMTAKAGRQRQILRDQKYPTDFKGVYYKEATDAISVSVASNLENLKPVETAAKVLAQLTPDKIGTQRRIAANIDALESFLQMLDDIDLKGSATRLGDQSPPRLTIHGVEISVRPEVILSAVGKSQAPLVGALKLHFPRTFSLNEDSAGYASAILQEWCKVHLSDEGAVNGAMCCVVDVGSQTVYPGVKATTARMKDVEAICQNIAALWPTI